MQAVKFIGCLKNLKSSLSCTQQRKRKERKRNVGFAYCSIKKIWNLREERPCGMRLRNYEWCQWVERSGEWEHLFFFFLGSDMHLPAEIRYFIWFGQNGLVWVGIYIRTKQPCFCTNRGIRMVNIGYTGWYDT